MRAFFPFLFLLLLLVAPSGLLAGEPLPLRDNERIVVLTDLSLKDSSWPILLEQYIRVRYPEKHVSFFTLSFGEKGVEEAADHLRDGVLTLCPTLVFLHFGPEAAASAGVNWQRQQSFTETLQRLCEGIARNNIPLVILGGYAGLEETRFQLPWGAFRADNQSVASELNGYWVDFAPLMKKYSDENLSMTSNGSLTEAGHMAALISILQNLKWAVPVNLSVPASARMGRAASLDTTISPEPSSRMSFCVPESLAGWTASESSIAEILNIGLRVPDLAPGKYTVSIDGDSKGIFTSERLGEGVYLLPGKSLNPSLVREWVGRKQLLFSAQWISALRLGAPSVGRQHMMAGAVTAAEGFEEMICQLAKGSNSEHLDILQTFTP